MMRLRNINRSSSHKNLVDLLANPEEGKENKLFETIKSLMIFAAFLGYAEKRREPLDKQPKEDIQKYIFENELDYLYLIALAESKDPSIFKEDNDYDIVTVFEEYANGGLEITGWVNQYKGYSGQRAIIQGLYQNQYIKDTETIDLEKLTDSIKF